MSREKGRWSWFRRNCQPVAGGALAVCLLLVGHAAHLSTEGAAPMHLAHHEAPLPGDRRGRALRANARRIRPRATPDVQRG